MLYREVDSTCVRDTSRQSTVPADNSASQKLELKVLLDRWSKDVRPFLENACASIDVSPRSDRSGFTFEGTLRVDCHVKGVLPSGSGTLIVGRQGRCDADAFVGTAIIEGVVNGDIHAAELIELDGRARVTGKIEAPAISIGRSAVFEGECHVSPKQLDLKIDEPGEPSPKSVKYEAEKDELMIAAS